MTADILKSDSPKEVFFPDIAIESDAKVTGSLTKVGMEEVEIAIKLQDSSGESYKAAAFANLYVSLDAPKAKGIHMSRLLLETQEIFDEESLNYQSLRKLVQRLKNSHADISKNAYAEIRFDYMFEKTALISKNKAVRFYPVCLKAEINEQNEALFKTKIRITYSSTCPCSAALSRQLIQESFLKAFGDGKANLSDIYNWLGTEESQVATPHSQRSYADVEIGHTEELDLKECILNLEGCLETPVQAAVKREDEQEFARLNGKNLMFSEDAARRLKFFCETQKKFLDFTIKVQHLESLHAHNAVAFARKSSR